MAFLDSYNYTNVCLCTFSLLTTSKVFQNQALERYPLASLVRIPESHCFAVLARNYRLRDDASLVVEFLKTTIKS